MANYVFAYKGGSMAATESEREAAMAAWGSWFGSLGAAVVEVGNPFGASPSVSPNGSSGQAGSLSGYSVVAADDLAAAAELAKGAPVVANGGSVEVYETIQVM